MDIAGLSKPKDYNVYPGFGTAPGSQLLVAEMAPKLSLSFIIFPFKSFIKL